jgi:hypothetical protein
LDLTEARRLAAGLMAGHGLTGWRLVFDNARPGPACAASTAGRSGCPAR